METGGRITVPGIQDVVNAGGELKVLDELLAEERQVDDAKTGRILALHGNGLAAGVRGVVEAEAVAGVLEFHTRKDFVPDQRHTEIELEQVVGRVRHIPANRVIPGALKRIARPAANSAGPEAFQGQLHAFGIRVEVGEAPAVEDNQIVHPIVEAGEGRPQMSSDVLLVHQLIAGNLLRLDVLEPRIAQLREIRRAEGGSVNGFERGFLPGTVDGRHARIERGLVIAVLIITYAANEMEIGPHLEIALDD